MKKNYDSPVLVLQFAEENDIIVTSLTNMTNGFGDVLQWDI